MICFLGGYSGKNLREGVEGGTHRKINYFSMLVVGSFKYTLSESGKSPAGKPKGKNDE